MGGPAALLTLHGAVKHRLAARAAFQLGVCAVRLAVRTAAAALVAFAARRLFSPTPLARINRPTNNSVQNRRRGLR